MDIQIADDIITAAQLKGQLTTHLKRLRESPRPLVVTQHGRPAAVLLAPEEYDRLISQGAVVQMVNVGLAELDTGQGLAHEDAMRLIRDTVHPGAAS